MLTLIIPSCGSATGSRVLEKFQRKKGNVEENARVKQPVRFKLVFALFQTIVCYVLVKFLKHSKVTKTDMVSILNPKRKLQMRFEMDNGQFKM